MVARSFQKCDVLTLEASHPNKAQSHLRRKVTESSTSGILIGLIFACFRRTVTTQFEFTTHAWATNP
jgi:hypothetical protein